MPPVNFLGAKIVRSRYCSGSALPRSRPVQPILFPVRFGPRRLHYRQRLSVLLGCVAMNPATYRAIKAILEADTSMSDSQRNAALGACQASEQQAARKSQSRPQFLSAKEVAEILHASLGTVWRLARRGRIHRVKLGHRCTRFRLDEIEHISSI